jgi:hypothetical protein
MDIEDLLNTWFRDECYWSFQHLMSTVFMVKRDTAFLDDVEMLGLVNLSYDYRTGRHEDFTDIDVGGEMMLKGAFDLRDSCHLVY